MSSMSDRYRLGGFHFDPRSGELELVDDGVREVRRLPPQPARLLTLLLEKNGALLGHEEIREALWPDVQVDFEQALHFCVRQVRSALDDSAGSPRFIETLPRRGYRILCEVERLETEGQEDAGVSPATRASSPLSRRRLLLLAGLVLLVGTVWSLSRVFFRHEVPARLRIAIMPFQPGEEFAVEAKTGRIAEELLLLLSRVESPSPPGFIGPTTTTAYAKFPDPVRRLGAELGVDYVINGRFLAEGETTRLLAELIRVEDGVHVWVESFPDLGAWKAIADTIARNVIATLHLSRDAGS